MTHHVDRTAAETLIAYLNSRFPARRKARARFTRFHKTNHASAWGRTMTFSQMPKVYVVLHEFAHVLDQRVNPYAHHHSHEWHTESFYHNLLRVLDALCEPRHAYPWQKEYRQLYRWAKRDGYAS